MGRGDGPATYQADGRLAFSACIICAVLQRTAGKAHLRVVKVERKECKACRTRGWAGDDIYEDGVFNYNGNVVVELRLLYTIRAVVKAGTPVSTWAKTFLGELINDMDWLEASEDNRVLASR